MSGNVPISQTKTSPTNIMKIKFLSLLLILGITAGFAQAAMKMPTPEEVAAATEKLQSAEIISKEDAAYFNQYGIAGKKIDGTKVVTLFNSMAKYKGSTSTDYSENLKFLGDQKVIANTKSWETANTKGAAGGMASLVILRFAQAVK